MPLFAWVPMQSRIFARAPLPNSQMSYRKNRILGPPSDNMAEEEDEMPFVFKITAPFARMKIRSLGFDRRKRETKIYEYAIHRYYMDFIEIFVALTIMVVRIYLAFDLGQPYSGTVPLNGSDVFVFMLTVSTFMKNWTLISDYRKNVVGRIETAAGNR
jgi:hypothetical protein